MKKRMIAAFIGALLCWTLLPAFVVSAEEETTDPGTAAPTVTTVPGKGLAVAMEGGGLYIDSRTGAVTGCDAGVTEADIPEQAGDVTVTRINEGAFASCLKLTEIRIPATVTEVEAGAFRDCLNLENIWVTGGSEAFSSRDGVLYDREKTRLLCYPAGKKDNTYRMPSTVTEIAPRALEDTENLQTLYLSASLATLEEEALKNAIGLKRIVFPEELVLIGDRAFSGCQSLESLDIPEGVVSIGEAAFDTCVKLKSLSLPDSVVLLGDNMTKDCSALEEIQVSQGNRRFASEDGVLFNQTKTKLICYPAGAARTVYFVPDTVREAEEGAFQGVTNLQSIILPASLKSLGEDQFTGLNTVTEVTFSEGTEKIGGFAFSECANLERVILPASLTSLDGAAFADCPKLKDVYYSGSEAAWNRASHWPAGEPYASIRIHYNTVAGLPMDDIEAGRWSAADITYAYQHRLMQGTAPGVFEPMTRTTRGMIVTILYRLAGSPEVSGGQPFGDVASDSYYAAAVKWAANSQVVNGTGEGTFEPENGITREQLATILYRYARSQGIGTAAGDGAIDPANFSDAGEISAYAQEAMAWATRTGLINGNDGRLEPQVTASREQVAVILHRFCER